jgi:hypothetical protein
LSLSQIFKERRIIMGKTVGKTSEECVLCEKRCRGAVRYVDGSALCKACYEDLLFCDVCRKKMFCSDGKISEDIAVCKDCYTAKMDTCDLCYSLIFKDDAWYRKGHVYCRECNLLS